MEGPDHSQLSDAMLAFLWEEFIKRARVPAVAVDIALIRLGLAPDFNGRQPQETDFPSEGSPLINLEDFLSVVVPVINDEVRSANAEERELTGFLGELQEWPESLGALLCQRFSVMLPPLLFFEPDTIPMSDGRDGGDGSGTLTGPMTNSWGPVIIEGWPGVPETTEEGYTSSSSRPDSEATLVLPTHDSTPAPQREDGFEMGPEMCVSATLPPPPQSETDSPMKS